MRDIKVICVFLLLNLGVFSQTAEQLVKETEVHLLKKLGKNALKQNDPNSAIVFLEHYNKVNRGDAEGLYFLGQAYMEVRNYDRASHSFLSSYKNQKSRTSDALYYHAQMLKSVGKYDSAKYNFEKFKKEYKGLNKAIKKQAGLEVNYCDSIHKLTRDTYKTMLVRLDTSINKINSESAPLSLDNNHFVFSSLRTNKKEYIFEDDSTTNYTKRKMYMAEKKGTKWVFKGEFGTHFNDDDFNVGNAAISADKKRMYFTRCQLNDEEQMVCAIYVSEKTGVNWGIPKKLPKPVNGKKYSSTMPTIGTDAKGNDIIYFVSNRKGGKGGFDIWYTSYDKKHGEYRYPKNAGSKINTAGSEMSPYFDHETHSLFFSSNDMPGLGGYDIYKATSDGKRWVSVINIGKPFNSGADDIYYTVATQHDEGFFVSNRKGGAALPGSTCCDDIYHFKIKELLYVNLVGSLSAEGTKKKNLANAKVEIYAKNKLTNERYLVKTVTTDSLGNYNTFLEPNKLYEVVVKKKDFLSKTEVVSTETLLPGQVLIKKSKIDKKPVNPITLPNINYEFNKSEIDKKAKHTVDSLIFTFMTNNPTLVMEFHSHTDSKGEEEFNLKLSQARAESIVNYLLKKGIDKKRMKAIGFGESQPIAPNQKPDGSDNPEGRAKNRRTDMKVVGELEETEKD